MAQQHYDIDLRNTVFPMLSTEQTRTVIGKTVGEAPAAHKRPHIAYCHNVMPTEYGVRSVGFTSQLAAISENASIVDVRVIFDSNGDRVYFALSSLGVAYISREASVGWTPLPSTFFFGISFSTDKVTAGRVNGITYLFYANKGAVILDATLGDLSEITLVGLDPTLILGVAGSSGYLVAYSETAVSWSSTIDPTDFVPDKVTGAGGGLVANIAGNIKYVVVNTLGLLIYTEANTVAATYTGNSQFPFKFREVSSSRGAQSLDLIAYEANSAEQFVYSNVGLRSVTSQSSEAILPEVTDFLAGRVIEDFDAKDNEYIYTTLSGTMKKKIKYISSRYLVISYGENEFTHALVFDTALKKMGKLKFTHTDVIDYIADQPELARESLALVTDSGQLYTVDFSETADSSAAVLILGKLQASKSRGLQLLAVEVENVDTDYNFSMFSLISYNGKSGSALSEGALVESSEDYRRYNFRASGKNHSLVFSGKFDLTTAQVIYTEAGRR